MVAKERFQMEIKNMLLGACVLTRYNNRLYRVDDVDFSLSPSCTFNRGAKAKDETSITYKDYYKQQYNLTIKDMTQPMLLSKIKKRQSGMEVKKLEFNVEILNNGILLQIDAGATSCFGAWIVLLDWVDGWDEEWLQGDEGHCSLYASDSKPKTLFPQTIYQCCKK